MIRTCLLLLVCSLSLLAQSRTASLVGTVTDPTGATVAGAKITAVNSETNFSYTGTTNETGSYYIPYVNPGPYEVSAEAAGFMKYVRKGIELRAGESPRINIALQLGAVAESVIVTGAAPLLETETSTTSATLQNQIFMRIPVQQMRTYNILTYLPGVNNTGFNAFNAIGQRNRSMGYTIDGISAKEPVRGTATSHTDTVQTTTDALAEVKLFTTGIPAEYGHIGSGAIVAVMKGGTNELHGSFEDRYINKNLLHRRYFDTARSTNPFAYHELAATIGGPVVLPKIYNGRDKTFWFFAWQRHHENASETEFFNIPTADMLNGDFSFDGKGYPIYDPATTRQEGGQWVRDPFPGNRIPTNRFDPVAKNFLGYNPWKEPNQPGYVEAGGVRQNYAGPTTYRSFRSRFDTKIDHQFSDAHKFQARYSHNRHRMWQDRGTVGINWQLLNSGAVPIPTDFGNTAISDTYTISPTLINEFRFGMNRRAYQRNPEATNQGWAEKLGIPNTLPDGFPEFAGIGYTVTPGGFSQSVSEDFTFSENLMKVSGRHTLKWGYELVRSRYNNRDEDRPSGTFNMGGTDFPYRPNTGNGFASFLLGSVSSARFRQTRATWLPRWSTHGFYIQDDFKPTSSVTLNLGLRWSYESPYQTKYGQQSQFDPTVKDPITGKLGAITHVGGALAKRDLNNFQPRFGLAWTIKPDLVFRGSFGLMTVDLQGPETNMNFEEYYAEANVQPPPGDPRVAFYLSQGPPAIAYNLNADGTVPFVGTNYSSRRASWYDPNMRMPYIMSWSGGLQWQFSSEWLLELMYQGSSGVGLMNRWDINAIPLNVSTDVAVLDSIYKATQNYKPWNQFGEIRHWSNYGHSSYHGATIRAEKRYSRGITLNAFYTWSKALNDTDGDTGVGGITFYNRALEKGVAGFDLTHRAVVVATWELPIGSGRPFLNRGGVINGIFGGWELSWTQCMQSGLPFTVTASGSPNRYLPGTQRPNMVATFDEAVVEDWNIGPNRFPRSAQNPYLNKAAFAYAPAYTAGNLGRNTFRGPWLFWPQASLSKQWSIRERAKLSVRWDVSNVFKRPQFARPGTTFDTRNLGDFGTFNGELGNFAEIGSRFHSILGVRFQW